MTGITKAALEAAFESEKKTPMCAVGRIIHENEHGDLIEDKIMDVLNYSAPTVARVLKGLGLGVTSAESIQKHRKGLCRCR